jgi:hypothetical protein
MTDSMSGCSWAAFNRTVVVIYGRQSVAARILCFFFDQNGDDARSKMAQLRRWKKPGSCPADRRKLWFFSWFLTLSPWVAISRSRFHARTHQFLV